MKNKFFLLLSSFSLLLVACQGNQVSTSGDSSLSNTDNSASLVLDYSIISHSGAPSLGFYPWAKSGVLSTNSSVPVVLSAFAAASYDVIVMDHSQGLKQIINNNAPYQLARIITKGNFHLVGINKSSSDTPKTGDLIVSFGNAQGIPNQILQKVFPSIDNLNFVSSVSDTVPVIKTGLYGGEPVDYVLTAQPILHNIEMSGTSIFYDVDMQKKWNELSNLDGFPQAGVFVKTSLYQDNPDQLALFISQLDEATTNLIFHPQIAVDAMNGYGTSDEQKALFGVDSSTVDDLQLSEEMEDAPNNMGFATGKYSLTSYLEYMEQEDYPSLAYSPLF